MECVEEHQVFPHIPRTLAMANTLPPFESDTETVIKSVPTSITSGRGSNTVAVVILAGGDGCSEWGVIRDKMGEV